MRPVICIHLKALVPLSPAPPRPGPGHKNLSATNELWAGLFFDDYEGTATASNRATIEETEKTGPRKVSFGILFSSSSSSSFCLACIIAIYIIIAVHENPSSETNDILYLSVPNPCSHTPHSVSNQPCGSVFSAMWPAKNYERKSRRSMGGRLWRIPLSLTLSVYLSLTRALILDLHAVRYDKLYQLFPYPIRTEEEKKTPQPLFHSAVCRIYKYYIFYRISKLEISTPHIIHITEVYGELVFAFSPVAVVRCCCCCWFSGWYQTIFIW